MDILSWYEEAFGEAINRQKTTKKGPKHEKRSLLSCPEPKKAPKHEERTIKREFVGVFFFSFPHDKNI